MNLIASILRVVRLELPEFEDDVFFSIVLRVC